MIHASDSDEDYLVRMQTDGDPLSSFYSNLFALELSTSQTQVSTLSFKDRHDGDDD